MRRRADCSLARGNRVAELARNGKALRGDVEHELRTEAGLNDARSPALRSCDRDARLMDLADVLPEDDREEICLRSFYP